MEHLPDYYAVLGVDMNTPPDVLKKAFKHLALQYHPDVYKGEDAEEKTREILLAYKTLTDPERRRVYDLSRSKQGSGNSQPTEKTPNGSSAVRSDQQRAFVFPLFNDGMPAQIDLSEITYLLSASEIRRLKEQGMLRGAKMASIAGTYYCHRCSHRWQAASLPAVCPHCQARDWREYLLLRCQHCHTNLRSEGQNSDGAPCIAIHGKLVSVNADWYQAVFESEQIRYEIGSLHYGDGSLCPPYELFPLCPACGKAKWCPAEEERLWNVRDRAARKEKWRRRFGLE